MKLAWFPVDHLPLNRLPWTREYVDDAVADHPVPVSGTQIQPNWQVLVMRVLYALADLRDRLTGRM